MKIIKIKCVDNSTEIISAINKIIPGLKWRDFFVGKEAERMAQMKAVKSGDFIVVGFKIWVDEDRQKVTFSIYRTKPNDSKKESEKSWTTTYKNVANQSKRFYNLYKSTIDGVKSYYQKVHSDDMKVKEEAL